MISSARRWLLVSLSPLVAMRAHADPLPKPLAARVAARLADAWRVPLEQMRLEWGRATSGMPEHAEAPFRIVGRGDAGWFVVVFHPGETCAAAVRLRAGVERTVAVAARPLPAGHVLAAGDLREEVRVHWGPPDADSLELAGPGWETRRPLAPGASASWPAVQPPPLVRAGERVRLEWRRAGVHVEVEGIALNCAHRGETVRARLDERPACLAGRVTSRGVAALATQESR